MTKKAIGNAVCVLGLALAIAMSPFFAEQASAQGLTAKTPEISSGGEMAGQGQVPEWLGPFTGKAAPLGEPPLTESFVLGNKFFGPDIDLDAQLNPSGFFYIPPDPMGAAGPDRVIAVVNTVIQARSKAGVLLWQSSLAGMFSAVSPCYLGTDTFDPKIVYDHYANRFVVVTLERVNSGTNPSAGNRSRILVAVSKTSTPASATAADWWYCCIDAKETITGVEVWADYPGFEIDEEAIYITNNMFAFPPISGYGGSRLWVIAKGLGSGGFYDGGACSWNKYDPYAATSGSGSVATTTMPALVFGAAGAGPGVGTYLVSYSGLTNGFTEFLQVIRVNNPLGAVSFTHDFIPVADLEASFILADAPQLGTSQTIEVNDQRALDAVWRNNELWFCATLNPDGTGTPAPSLPNHTTAYWFKVNTSGVTGSGSPAGLLALADHGGIAGEELANPPGSTDIYTFFPSIAVNSLGEVKIGFSASGANIYGGAYATGRKPTDPFGTMRPAGTLHLGSAPYVRTFDAPPCQSTPARNRWGDYSGIGLDPSDDRIFWVFNEMAIQQGSPTTGGCNGRPDPEDGRWGTCWAECALPCVSVSCPQSPLVVGNGQGAGSNFTMQFCFTNCGALTTVYDYNLSDTQGWCAGSSGSVTLAPGATHCITVNCSVPGATPGGTTNVVTLDAEPQGCPLDKQTCSTSVIVDVLIPVAIESFEAISNADGVLLSWDLGANWQEDLLGLRVQRADQEEGPYTDLGDAQLAPSDRMSFQDISVEPGRDYWYRIVTLAADGAGMAGPIRVTTSELSMQTQLFAPYAPEGGGPIQIRYSLAGAGSMSRLEVFDVRGRRVRLLDRGQRAAGTYLKTWDRRDDAGALAARGVYFVNLTADGTRHSQKLVLIGR